VIVLESKVCLRKKTKFNLFVLNKQVIL